MKINWKVRFKNPNFWIGISGVAIAPILSYYGCRIEDFNSWNSVIEMFQNFIGNPYLIASVIMAILGFLGVVTDHTTEGISDSKTALTYDCPKCDEVCTCDKDKK